jgi:hypothetical protein
VTDWAHMPPEWSFLDVRGVPSPGGAVLHKPTYLTAEGPLFHRHSDKPYRTSPASRAGPPLARGASGPPWQGVGQGVQRGVGELAPAWGGAVAGEKGCLIFLYSVLISRDLAIQEVARFC